MAAGEKKKPAACFMQIGVKQGVKGENKVKRSPVNTADTGLLKYKHVIPRG